MSISVEQLFDWTPPSEGDPPKYAAVRAAALGFARTIAQYCPPGPDASTAIYKVREAWFFANESLQKKGG